ncbi:23S rRNA pseudouridine synthase [Paucilactobacillus hokkaidonensis JCM 18461]|uniref:Pseudouridine synthase n=2 Tax=Paucilactobacillus hokkaidonensis TaxID=1193095 RepID=A0A0A1GUG3_9LACO|nr:RluA family pseudouridine synthase [Paucilactobacillus hokkaidonensis]KRO09950.1 pseudouridine synthase [Paucilactobacillus hokkaidonensis]BAP85932.1 23S rRNA pseudouridine synthase [Paucilactobacillus hokkaidonensis JCM 18461]
MKFSWTYQDSAPIKVRTFLGMHGVTRALMIVAKYHGGDILVNGQHVWTINLMQTGDQATLVLPDETASENVDSSDDPIDILYEDNDYLILNKPAGVASVPAHNVARADSLVNRVKGYYQRQNYADQVTHIATRLDKNTSGIVVFPKHHFAHSAFDQQLKQHRVVKKYQAIVAGNLTVQHGLIDAPIQRDPESFVKRQVGAVAGKNSQTEYWRQRQGKRACLVSVLLHTGRTHQIRVHFSYLKHPLVGDDMYGGPDWMQRQALHCGNLNFYSPFLQRYIEINCPLPADMQEFIDQM